MKVRVREMLKDFVKETNLQIERRKWLEIKRDREKRIVEVELEIGIS